MNNFFSFFFLKKKGTHHVRRCETTIRNDGYQSIFRLVFQGEYVVRCPLVRKIWLGQLTKGKTSPLVFFSG